MHVTSLGDRMVKVTLTGRLDTPGVDRVETRLVASIVSGSNSAIVDLSQVDFIGSMGIRMLVSMARNLRVRRAALALYGAQTHVNEVFDAVSLQQIIAICSTEAEALATISAPPA